MITLKRFLRSWERLTEARRQSLLTDYDIDMITNSKSEMYLIDNKTLSGFQLDPDKSVTVIVSGVDYFQYYRTNDIRVRYETEIPRVYDRMLQKERINADRLRNMLLFIEDVATLDKVGNDV